MKHIVLVTTACLFFANTNAQAPQKMSYQAVIRNGSNALVTNQTVGMRISILQGSATGTAVYVETQKPTTNNNGLVSFEIGAGTIVSGRFDTIKWAKGPYFVKTETDPSGGTNYSISGTSQLLSVPYAFYAETSGTAKGYGNYTHYIGEEFGGGVIFHLWKDTGNVEHGLVVDLIDLSSSQAWSNEQTALSGVSGQSTWDGLSNSNDIVAQAGHTNSAALICLNSTHGGQSDWYLPSYHEMNALWGQYYTVARALSGISGASELVPQGGYWTSTVSASSSSEFPWTFYFSSGNANNGNSKSAGFRVRAIRAF